MFAPYVVRLCCLLTLGLLVLSVGCSPQPTSMVPGTEEQAGAAKNGQPAEAQAPLPEPQRANVNLCKVGAKLRDDNAAQKIITGAPSKLLDVRAGSVLNIQIPEAIKLFKAEHGRVPKNHAEFTTRIVEFNQLKLPELLDGLVYQFNPEKEELWAYPKDKVPAEK